MGKHLVVLLGLVLIALVAVGLSIGAADANVDKDTKKAAKQEKKCDKLENKNDKREAKGKEPKPLPDYCGFTPEITVTTDTGVGVTITQVIDPTIIDPERDGTWGSIGTFFDLQADGPFNTAEIRVTYDPTQLEFYMREDSLRLNFWDESINDWAAPLSSGVNTDENYVWAIVDHFSQYAPIGDASPAFANNFEFTRASKPELPLGMYIKNNYEAHNADDVESVPYDTRSTDSYVSQSHSFLFDAPVLNPLDRPDYDLWFETGVFEVKPDTLYTLTAYAKYIDTTPNQDWESGQTYYGILTFYDFDAGMNWIPPMELVHFNATDAWKATDYIDLVVTPQDGGWLKIEATFRTFPDQAYSKLAVQHYAYDRGTNADKFLVDNLGLLEAAEV